MRPEGAKSPGNRVTVPKPGKNEPEMPIRARIRRLTAVPGHRGQLKRPFVQQFLRTPQPNHIPLAARPSTYKTVGADCSDKSNLPEQRSVWAPNKVKNCLHTAKRRLNAVMVRATLADRGAVPEWGLMQPPVIAFDASD